jgi:hypothetical protein
MTQKIESPDLPGRFRGHPQSGQVAQLGGLRVDRVGAGDDTGVLAALRSQTLSRMQQ